MKIDALGHVALNVGDLRRSEAFYAGILGMTESGRLGPDMTFLRVSDDRFQDLALTETGDRGRGAVGLNHVAFRIEGSLDQLRAAQTRLAALGMTVRGPVDHTWSASLYLTDPDGNGIEMYVDRSNVWRTNPDFMPTSTLIDEASPTTSLRLSIDAK